MIHGNESSIAEQVKEVSKIPGLKTVLTVKSDDLLNPYVFFNPHSLSTFYTQSLTPLYLTLYELKSYKIFFRYGDLVA